MPEHPKSDDDALEAAMHAQDPWGWFRWLANLYGDRANISEDPGSSSYMGHGVADVIPFGLGHRAYDFLNGKNNGALDAYFNGLSPATYNNWATWSIVGGMALNVGAAFGAVWAGGAAAGAFAESGAASAVSDFWLGLRCTGYRWAVPFAPTLDFVLKGRYGQRMISWATGFVQNTRSINMLGMSTYRIPDIWEKAKMMIGDVKHAASVGFTPQLRDMLYWAESSGYTMHLYTRVNTTFLPPLQQAIDQGRIIVHSVIPSW